MNTSDVKLIGVLAKLSGFKGKYVLISDSYLSEEIENWESVFIEIDGLLVPFFIEEVSFISDTSAFITLEDISTSEKAKEFLNCNVFQTITILGNEEVEDSIKLLIGYNVIDKNKGAVGKIDNIIDYHNNVLFSILRNDFEILIPVVDNFIIHVDHNGKEIHVDTPEGLLDLNGF